MTKKKKKKTFTRNFEKKNECFEKNFERFEKKLTFAGTHFGT